MPWCQLVTIKTVLYLRELRLKSFSYPLWRSYLHNKPIIVLLGYLVFCTLHQCIFWSAYLFCQRYHSVVRPGTPRCKARWICTWKGDFGIIPIRLVRSSCHGIIHNFYFLSILLFFPSRHLPHRSKNRTDTTVVVAATATAATKLVHSLASKHVRKKQLLDPSTCLSPVLSVCLSRASKGDFQQ